MLPLPLRAAIVVAGVVHSSGCFSLTRSFLEIESFESVGILAGILGALMTL